MRKWNNFREISWNFILRKSHENFAESFCENEKSHETYKACMVHTVSFFDITLHFGRIKELMCGNVRIQSLGLKQKCSFSHFREN
jgi:hypothetical protein